MDPVTITGTCVGLLAAITALSKDLTKFVSRTKQARKDVDGFSRELASLNLCISSLHDEDFIFPPHLHRQLLTVLGNCERTVEEMTAIVRKHSLGNSTWRLQWSFTDGQDVSRLQDRLEAHKSTLNITLDLGQLAVVNSIKEDTCELRAELRHLRIQVSTLKASGASDSPMLQRFLDESLSYAESVVDPSSPDEEQMPVTDDTNPIRTAPRHTEYLAGGHIKQSKDWFAQRCSETSESGNLGHTAHSRMASPSQIIVARPHYLSFGTRLTYSIRLGRDLQCCHWWRYCSFSIAPIDLFSGGGTSQRLESIVPFGDACAPEDLAWIRETSRGVFCIWEKFKSFTYEDGAVEGVLHRPFALNFLHLREKIGFTEHVRICFRTHKDVFELWGESPAATNECWAWLDEAYQDAKALEPIITGLQSYKTNVWRLKQDRSPQTMQRLVPGTFADLEKQHRERAVQLGPGLDFSEPAPISGQPSQ